MEATKNFHLYSAIRLNSTEEIMKLSKRLTNAGVENESRSFLTVVHLTANTLNELSGALTTIEEELLTNYIDVMKSTIKLYTENGDDIPAELAQALQDFSEKYYINSKFKSYEENKKKIVEVYYNQLF